MTSQQQFSRDRLSAHQQFSRDRLVSQQRDRLVSQQRDRLASQQRNTSTSSPSGDYRTTISSSGTTRFTSSGNFGNRINNISGNYRYPKNNKSNLILNQQGIGVKPVQEEKFVEISTPTFFPVFTGNFVHLRGI